MSDEQVLYRRLAQAIEAVARYEEAEGVLTEWVVVTATERFDDDGTKLTQICTLLPADHVPYHRVMGLLDYALSLKRAEITAP